MDAGEGTRQPIDLPQVRTAAAAILALFTVSCGPGIRPDFNAADPSARKAAIVQAAARHDQSAIPDLVRMLDSDDPAVRLLAIRTLEDLTGERFDYQPGAPTAQREAAIARWEAYAREHSASVATTALIDPTLPPAPDAPRRNP